MIVRVDRAKGLDTRATADLIEVRPGEVWLFEAEEKDKQQSKRSLWADFTDFMAILSICVVYEICDAFIQGKTDGSAEAAPNRKLIYLSFCDAAYVCGVSAAAV